MDVQWVTEFTIYVRQILHLVTGFSNHVLSLYFPWEFLESQLSLRPEELYPTLGF